VYKRVSEIIKKVKMKKYILYSSLYSMVIMLFSNCSENQKEFENKLTRARECLNKPLHYQKDFDGAIGFYTHAITIDSTKSIAFYERGMAYDQKGEQLLLHFKGGRKLGGDSVARPFYLKALSDLNKAIYLDPTNPVYYKARAYFYRNSYHFNLQKSIADHDKVLQLNPKDYDALCSRGSMKFYDLKDSTAAFSDFKEAVKIDPENYRAYQDWGDCLYECGSYYEAISKYRMWVKLKPLDEDGNPHALHFLTKAQIALGDYYAVIANCERIREYDPDWAEAYHYSAEAKIKLGLIDIGKKELVQARKSGILSDLYFEFFGTEDEKEESRKNQEIWNEKYPNRNKKWPLKDKSYLNTYYE
jgi:tetratricopeptide (TPR) repeat protein